MTYAQEQQAREVPGGSSRWRIWLARAGWLLIFVLITAVFIESAPSASVYERRGWGFGEAAAAVWPYMSTITFANLVVAARFTALAVFYAVALLIAFRKWNDWFALFVSAALLMTAWGFVARSDTSTYFFPAWLNPVESILSTVFQSAFLLSWLLLFFILPNGRFVPGWTAWFILLPIAGVIPLITFDYLRPLIAPRNWELVGQVAWSVFLIAFLTAIIAGLFAQIHRYQNVATPAQRQQMKWILFGLALQPLPILLGMGGIPGDSPWSALFSMFFELLIVTMLPVSIGLAVFRRRLWDVDPLINRTLVYGGLTTGVLLLYGLVVGGASAIFETRSGLGAALVATLCAILIVPPLHHTLNRGIERWRPISPPPADAPEIIEQAVASTTPFATVISGRSLLAVRLIWASVTCLALILLVAGVRAAQAVDLVANMPAMAAQANIALFRIFAGNIFLASPLVNLASAVQTVTFMGVGLLIFLRRSDDWMVILASLMCITVGIGFTPFIFFLPVIWPQWTWPVAFLHTFLFTSLILFLFLFPNGRFVPRWARYAAVAWAAYALSWPLLPELDPHRGSSPVALIIFIAVAFLGLTSQVYRYRRDSDPVARQQTKWVLAGFLTTHICFFLIVAPAVSGLSNDLIANTPLRLDRLNAIFGLTSILIPVTIGFAILRYRLWDIDLVINRAIVYGGLTAIVIALYVVIVGGLSTLFQSSNSLALSILVTGLIAVMLNPLRLRLQQAINRLMYGDRDDPITLISELGRQLEHAAAPDDTLTTLVYTISRSLKLPYVAITTQSSESSQVIASSGAAQNVVLRFPLTYQSQPVGEMLIGHRAPGESFTTSERRLLNNVARQAGAAVYAAQLTDHLQRSREQLVLAREEERRRLQRDLHDGLGPQLASLSMQLDAARNLVAADSPATGDLLARLSTEAQAAIADIRRLVYDLRPLALDQLGLVGALQEFIVGQLNNDGPQVIFDAPQDLPPLPAALEVAVYRIVQEAVTNCVRHARASECHIRLAVNGALMVEIRDDGQGMPDRSVTGVGLASIRERAAELGGQCRIESRPGTGTLVTATFPLPKDLL